MVGRFKPTSLRRTTGGLAATLHGTARIRSFFGSGKKSMARSPGCVLSAIKASYWQPRMTVRLIATVMNYRVMRSGFVKGNWVLGPDSCVSFAVNNMGRCWKELTTIIWCVDKGGNGARMIHSASKHTRCRILCQNYKYLVYESRVIFLLVL